MHTCKLCPRMEFPAACVQNTPPMPSYPPFESAAAQSQTNCHHGSLLPSKQRCNRRCFYLQQMKQLRARDREINTLRQSIWLYGGLSLLCCLLLAETYCIAGKQFTRSDKQLIQYSVYLLVKGKGETTALTLPEQNMEACLFDLVLFACCYKACSSQPYLCVHVCVCVRGFACQSC